MARCFLRFARQGTLHQRKRSVCIEFVSQESISVLLILFVLFLFFFGSLKYGQKSSEWISTYEPLLVVDVHWSWYPGMLHFNLFQWKISEHSAWNTMNKGEMSFLRVVMLNYFGTISALVGSFFKIFPILRASGTMEFNVGFASGKSAVEGEGKK